MNGYVALAVRLVEAAKRIQAEKWSFFGVFAVVFSGSVLALGAFGLLPETLKPSGLPAVSLSASATVATSSTPVAQAEEPTRITIAAIGLDATVANPTTTKIEVLDGYLLEGAVRYPTSARLGETGNVVIFGHSSYLPVVGNPAYKTFNGIQKLAIGDTITVYAADAAYTYRVRSVAKESAASDAGIPLAVAGRVLTLATCDSFGKKTDRFIVTADFVESHMIQS